MQVTGTIQPAWLDVDEAYGSIEGSVAAYLASHLPTTPTLALHAAGKKVWGTTGRIPFFDAAFVGTPSTVRGFSTNRFAGDASLVGSAELRLHLTNPSLLLPGQQGVFGFYDVGRVYQSGEHSDDWHTGVGGGLWFGFLGRVAAATASVGHSDEGNRFYLGAGFAF